MGRSIAAVLLGIIGGGLVVYCVEAVGHVIYPPPPGIDLTNPDALKRIMVDLPFGALVMVLIAWALGSFVGGWLAALIARRATTLHALIVGLVLMAGGIANMFVIPHPLWFWVVGLALFLPAAYAGSRLVGAAEGV